MPSSLVIAFFLLQSAGATASDKTGKIEAIRAEVAAGDLQTASTELERTLRADDRDFSAHMMLGIVRQRQARLQDAMAEFNFAHELRPNDAAPLVDMGNVLMVRGQLEAASDSFQSAIRLDPRNVSAHRNMGILRIQQRQNADAVAELKMTVSLAPKDADNWFALLQAELANGDLSSARDAARQIGRLAPASSELFRSVGAAQASAGDYQGAIQNLQRALDATPESSEIRYNLALAYLRNNEPAKALPLLNALQNANDSAEVEDLLGEACEVLDRPVDAVRAFELAARMDPRNEDYTYDYVDELLRHKNFDAALLIGRAAIDNFPRSLRIQLAMVGAYYGKEDLEQAHTLLTNASKSFPDSSLPLYMRSVIQEAEGKPDASLIEQTREYLGRHPEDAFGWLALGKAEVLTEPASAMASFERCLAIQEKTAGSHFELGRLYFNQNNWEKAAEHSQRAVELNPKLSEAWYRLALASYRLGRKAAGDAAMQRFRTQHAADQSKSAVTTFLYTLR